ncbi:hypothetical protein B0T25DRAFT_581541 [Lasiosphaeria hispida]|uniref:Heterokaryon incompatibility domain-containing protein n=1 Tax=Lasiosphaeria hispida TaxID=260671 RepID=A0AAJ0HJI1_9PEZI|nr:hypothetical protein B0T25DRAFT_581541 [Lasiosphaeria hispida]
MDYFPVPPGAEHIRVPYTCREPYDGGEWEGYPERKGWTQRDCFAYNNHGNRKWPEVQSFFQTWLYFGTIHAIFGMVGIKVEYKEFITCEETSRGKPRLYVTTKKLGEKIAAWKKLFWVYNNPTWWSSSKFATDTTKILDTVVNYLRLWGELRLPDSPNDSTVEAFAGKIMRGGCPVNRKILMSIIALCHVLRTVSVELYSVDSRNVSLTSILLKKKLEDAGWCKADTARLFREFTIATHYYVALYKCPYRRRKHSSCDTRVCRAVNIDESTYLTKHVNGCDCKDTLRAWIVGELVEHVVKVIDADGIPVVCWEEAEVLKVQDALADGTEYTAISHVWADGLGNPHENALPKCQLSRIQDLVNQLKSNSNTGHGRFFWMDTLCIPVGAEFKDRRKKSIAKMRQIYASATSVLALDNWLQKLPISSQLHEKTIRIFLCTWLHRLWTLQESILAKALYIQFDGGAQLIDDVKRGADELQTTSEATGYYGHFEITVHNSALGYLELKLSKGSEELRSGCLRFAAVARAMGQRSTSRYSDETLCIASAMGFDVEALLNIHGGSEEERSERRMELFFKQASALPPGIIFHHNPHLRRLGFRWAPKTLMGGRSGDFFRDIQNGVSPFDGTHLHVTYPGIILGPLKRAPGSSIVAVTFEMTHYRCYRVDLAYIEAEAEGNRDENPVIDWGAVTYLGIIIRQFSKTITQRARMSDAIFGAVENRGLHVDTIPQSGQQAILLADTIKLVCGGRCSIKEIGHLGGQDSNTYIMGRYLQEAQEWDVR